MTIENELLGIQELQQALYDFENDPDTEFMEPELANQIRDKYKTLISKRQRRAKRKENIANFVNSANEAEQLYSQADEMDKFKNASLPEQIARGAYSAAMKFDGGAAKMYGTGKKLAGFTARWLSDDQGAVADWGKEQMRQGTEFNAAVDDYIAKASGFNSEWADTDNAQLLSPSTWTPASVLKAGEGLMEFEAPMATVGLVSGAVGKTLNPLTRTAMEGAMIGVGNIPEHSDYIEQGSGKFKPRQAIASGLLSGELMSFAFLAGRGRGLSEAAAMNYAQQVGRTGVLGMGKQVFKEAALTGLANATLSGGVGGGIKEYFALPENYTQKDLSNAIDRVFNQMGHEFVMGVGFGAHGAVKGLMEARSTYDRFVPKGSNKNIDTEVSKYFFGKEGQKILKDKYPNLFAGEGSSADVNKFLEDIWNAIPNKLRVKNSSEMDGLFQNYRDALMAQWSMGKLEKTGIKNKIIKQFRAKMAQRISDALNAAQATQDQINNIDKQIQSKDTPLPQKQELAKQAEELRAQRDLDSEKIETPYTYDDLMNTSLDMVINKYGADSSLADRTIRLVDELSAQHGREYDVETFANLLNQVEVFLGQGNAGKNMRDWLLNRQSAEPRTEIIPESVLRQQNNNQDDTILPNTPGYGIEPNFSPIESNRPIMPEDVIASQNRENNRILSDKSATQSDIATQNPVYPSGGYSNEKGNPMKLFGQDRPNIGMPSSVKSESPVEPPAMSLKGKKLESPSTAMNKSQKSETLQTKGINAEKGELKGRDMPMSVSQPGKEPMAVKKESGEKQNKKSATEKSSAEDVIFVDSTTPELKELMRKQNNQTAVEDGLFKGNMESFGELLHKERYIDELPSELNWMAEKFNIFKARNLNDLSPEQIDKTLEHIDSMKKSGVFRSVNGNKLFKVATNIKKYLLKRKAELESQKPNVSEKATGSKKPTTKKSSVTQNAVLGKKTKMTTKANGGMKVDGEFAVVDVNKLKTATDIGETQNRNRKTVASQAQVNSIANNPNPEYLIVNNSDSANGAMVISSDGTVLSGNGRTLGLSEAYKYGNADKYKAYLKEHAPEFGIDPREIDKIENPVLVRIVDSKDGFDVKRFVKESNESRQLGRNSAEIARTDAENIKGILREFNNIDDIASPSNKEFIQKFFEKTVGDTERANYLAEDGSLTPDGLRRVENALIASLYGDNSRLIEKLTNTTNEGIKNIANALMATAKDGAKLKGEVDKGMYFDVDLTKEIGNAALTYADTVAEMQRQGVKGSPINFYLANMKDRLTPEGKLVFGMLSELNKKPKQIREFLQIINDVIRGHGDPQQGDLFAGKNPKPNKSQIIKEALQAFDSRYKTDFSKQDLSKWNKSERTLFGSRTKNKATNPVTDKELNNFLRGQAKQISKETGLNFKVVDSVDELRRMFPNNDITDTVEGGIHKDTVYLVRGNIDRDRLPLVIAHEVAGHRGVESLFENKQQMDNFFNSLERAAAKDKFIRDAFAEVDRLGYKENRSREAMAKIVEKVRNESGTLKGTAKTFVNFITSRVRRLLRRMGFKNLQLNEAEVYDIAVQALRRTGLKNSNKFFGLDRFLAKDNSFLSATSTELDQKYPGWSNRQTTSTGRHSTQAAITEKTYKKIGDWILNSNLKNSKILDASSGMGLGTEALRKMGLNVDDIEPYPGDRKIKPTYSGEDYLDYAEVYKKHGKTYDLIISNAVLNVIPDDWRKAQLHAMADVLLNKGGKLIINVRGDKEVANTKNKIILDSPNEILLPNGNGGYRAYQKGFSQKEFQDWVSKELGAGYKVEKLTPKNSGLSSSTTGVIVTKEGGNGGKMPKFDKGEFLASIGGKKAKTANIAKLEEAKKRLEDGEDKKKVWAETGWYIAKDGKPRFEISDKDYKLKEGWEFLPVITDDQYRYVHLKDVIDHKALFDAYPFLKDTKISFFDNSNSNSGGSFIPTENKIRLGSAGISRKNATPEMQRELEKTLIHEIQHAIQNYEDFAKGSNLLRGRVKFDKGFEKILDSLGDNQKLKDMTTELAETYINGSPKNPQDIEVIKQIREKISSITGDDKLADSVKDLVNNTKANIHNARRAYHYSYGEGEARAAANRLNLYDEMGGERGEQFGKGYFGYPEADNRFGFDFDPEKAIIDFTNPGVSESRKSPIEDAAGKASDEIFTYPKKRNAGVAKKVLDKAFDYYEKLKKGIFKNKKLTDYKASALKASYLTGYDTKEKETMERFKAIGDFNKTRDAVREYIDKTIPSDKRAKLLDSLMKQKTTEGIMDIAGKASIEKERAIRNSELEILKQNLKDLKANKISTEHSMLKLDALSEALTQEELDGLLNTNDFSTGAVKKMYKLLRTAKESLKVIESDEAGNLKVPDKIKALASELDSTFRDSLLGDDSSPSMKVSVETLAKLNQVLADVKNQSKEAMKNLIHDASNEAYTAQQKIIKEMGPVDESIANSREEKRIGTYNRYGKPVNSFENLDLDNFSAEMGDTMNKYTHKAILEGQKTVEHYLAKGYKEVDDIIKSFGSDKTEGMSNLEKSFMSVDTTNKHKYDITKDEAMAIYALATDRETKNLINKHGGLTLSLGDKKGSDTFILNADKLKEIESKLTTKEKELVMRGKKLLAQTYLPALNDVYERLNGVPLRLLVDGTYFPRTYQQGASEGSIKGIFDNLSQPYIVDSATGGYASFLKSRGDNVNLRLRGFTKTMESYVNQASNYIGMAEPLKKLNRILDNGMKKEIIQRYGVEYVERLDRAMKLISGMGGKTREDQQTLSRYLSNLAAAKLTPMSALKQFSSVPLASSVIPYEYLAKSAVSGLSKENIAEMMELDAMQLRYRDNGIGGIMPLNATTREAEHNLGTFKNTKWNKLVNWGLNLSLMADKRALGIIYKATKLMAEAKGKGGDKAWIENKFMEAVRRTQNTTDLASAPGWQELARNSSTWAFINMYLNQTQKIPNEFLRLKRFMTQAEKKHGKDSTQYKEAKGNMMNFIMGAALMNAMTLGVGSLAGAALHKDDKKKTAGQKAAGLAADTLLNFTGNPVLKTALGGSGYALQKALPKAFGGEGMRSNVDTFGNDLTGIIPDTAYTFGKVFDDINKDEPTARKFRKVTSDVLGSRAFESALAMGRIPTWFLRYPSQIWRNKLSDTESERRSSGRTGSGSWSLRRKRPTRRRR